MMMMTPIVGQTSLLENPILDVSCTIGSPSGFPPCSEPFCARIERLNPTSPASVRIIEQLVINTARRIHWP